MLQTIIIFASNSLHYLLHFTDRLEGAISTLLANKNNEPTSLYHYNVRCDDSDGH